MTNHRKRTTDVLLLMASTRLDMPHIQSFNNKKIYLERKMYYVNNLVHA